MTDMTYTDEQIAKWKQTHGEIYLITVEDKSCVLRKPRRQDLSYASVVKDPIKLSETLLNQLWVAGDEEIRTQDDYFFAAVNKMDTVMALKEAEIKKL